MPRQQRYVYSSRMQLFMLECLQVTTIRLQHAVYTAQSAAIKRRVIQHGTCTIASHLVYGELFAL